MRLHSLMENDIVVTNKEARGKGTIVVILTVQNRINLSNTSANTREIACSSKGNYIGFSGQHGPYC